MRSFLTMRQILALAVVLLSSVRCNEEDPLESMSVDYTTLADQAEMHKNDILSFLNQDPVKSQYKKHYESLLNGLIEPPKNTRRDDHEPNAALDLASGSTRRIVQGRNTSIAAVPWQVSLRERSYPTCGGSVVTDLWLITAAHCLLRARASDLSVRLGSSWKTHGGEMYDVRSSFVHPRYVSKAKVYDVGLVELYSPLRFSPRILPIRMVARESRLKADEPAIVSGWGKLKEGGPSATYLQSATIKTIPMKLCKRSGLDRKAIDPHVMFCAGSFTQPSSDACQGDSGGPIVHDGVLIGVVSWGLGCARGNFPGVYTRLANPTIHDWLQGYLARGKRNNTTTLT